jgi:TldD protein
VARGGTAQQGRPVRSHGCSYAHSWDNVQFQRMPNVSLLPGERTVSMDDLIAATDRGIAIIGDGSFSIDQQRYNAQFGGQLFYEIKGGKVVGDAQGRGLSDPHAGLLELDGHDRRQAQLRARRLVLRRQGTAGQVNAVSHGSPPARFRNVNVINTGRKA